MPDPLLQGASLKSPSLAPGPPAIIPSLLPPTYWSSAVSWESTCSSCDSEGWKITGKATFGDWGDFGGWLGFFGHTVEHTGSWLPDQGSNSCPLEWKHGVLTTGPPGKSQVFFFSIKCLLCQAERQPHDIHAPIHRARVCDLTGHKGRPGCDSVKDLAVGILAYPAGTSVILGSL